MTIPDDRFKLLKDNEGVQEHLMEAVEGGLMHRHTRETEPSVSVKLFGHTGRTGRTRNDISMMNYNDGYRIHCVVCVHLEI